MLDPQKKLRDVPDNIQTIDGNGLFVMPGMVEALTPIFHTLIVVH